MDTNMNINSNEWVNLGLPSGLLWASCNVGAAKPEEYGNYYSYGETQCKDEYNWDTYKFCAGIDEDDAFESNNHLTKYCTKAQNGHDGFTDNLTILEPCDDAATANLGGDSRTPTLDEWEEMLDNCTCIWSKQNGVNGRKFTGPNGNSIFLPAAGGYIDGDIDFDGSECCYMSASLDNDHPSCAWLLVFDSEEIEMSVDGRDLGHPVRAVHNN